MFRGDVLDALEQRQVEGVRPPDDDADGVDPERTRARGRGRRAMGSTTVPTPWRVCTRRSASTLEYAHAPCSR